MYSTSHNYIAKEKVYPREGQLTNDITARGLGNNTFFLGEPVLRSVYGCHHLLQLKVWVKGGRQNKQNELQSSKLSLDNFMYEWQGWPKEPETSKFQSRESKHFITDKYQKLLHRYLFSKNVIIKMIYLWLFSDLESPSHF